MEIKKFLIKKLNWYFDIKNILYQNQSKKKLLAM